MNNLWLIFYYYYFHIMIFRHAIEEGFLLLCVMHTVETVFAEYFETFCFLNSGVWCTPWSLTPLYYAHLGVRLRSAVWCTLHTVESDSGGECGTRRIRVARLAVVANLHTVLLFSEKNTQNFNSALAASVLQVILWFFKATQ